MSAGTKSGGFLGSISGSVRSLSVHPTEPLLASVGLDRFLRIYSTQSRKLLAKVFLKQQMVACAFDTDPSREVMLVYFASSPICKHLAATCLKNAGGPPNEIKH